MWKLLMAEWAKRPPEILYRDDRIKLLLEAIREELPQLIRGSPDLSLSDKSELLSVAGGIDRAKDYLADPKKIQLALFIAKVYTEYADRLFNFVEYDER